MKRTALITIASLLAIIASIFTFSYFQKASNEPQNTINTTVEPKDTAQIPETAPEVPKILESDLDTSTWKTYRNDEFGFEVKYPDIDRTEPGCETGRLEKCLWRVMVTPITDEGVVIKGSNQMKYTVIGKKISFNGSIEHAMGASLVLYVYDYEKVPENFVVYDGGSNSSTLIKTRSGIKMQPEIKKDMDVLYSVYFKNKNYLYRVENSSLSQDYINALLNTFKFVEADTNNPTPITSADIKKELDFQSWKTYVNKELKFQYKYPSNWGTCSSGFDGPSFNGADTGQFGSGPKPHVCVEGFGVTLYLKSEYTKEKIVDSFGSQLKDKGRTQTIGLERGAQEVVTEAHGEYNYYARAYVYETEKYFIVVGDGADAIPGSDKRRVFDNFVKNFKLL